MASKAVAKSIGGPIAVSQKYTTQSHGIWERIRRLLAVAPNRSNGIPLNPQYRNPPPGSNDPKAYDDPITLPAGDIADNPYWKRDVRRSYPKLSVVSQGDIVGLLTVGSREKPKEEALPVGDAGHKQLALVKEEGEKGLAAFFERDQGVMRSVLGENGLPPMPVGMHKKSAGAIKRYILEEEQTYGDEYPCRTFS